MNAFTKKIPVFLGFIVSLLFCLGFTLEFYGGSFIYAELDEMFVDLFIQILRFSFMGGVIGLVLGKLSPNV